MNPFSVRLMEINTRIIIIRIRINVKNDALPAPIITAYKEIKVHRCTRLNN